MINKPLSELKVSARRTKEIAIRKVIGAGAFGIVWTLSKNLLKLVLISILIALPLATIIDGMSLVQKLKVNDQTFSELAELALSHVLHEGVTSHRIDVIFDVYKETSIRDAERANRGADTGIKFKSIAPGHKITQ